MMFIPRFHGFSDVVAWGHHLHLPLRSRNRESRAPRGKKHTANNKNSRRRWHEFRHRDQMRPWRGRTSSPPATRLPTPPKTPPVTPCIFFCVGGTPAAPIIHRARSQKYRRSRILRRLYTIVGRPQQPPFLLRLPHE